MMVGVLRFAKAFVIIFSYLSTLKMIVAYILPVMRLLRFYHILFMHNQWIKKTSFFINITLNLDHRILILNF
jgi:hypothetical protein